MKYDVVSTLKSDVVSTLKYDVVSTLKSDFDSTLIYDVVSTLKSDVVSTFKSDGETTLKSDGETTLKMGCFPDVEINNVVSTLKIQCSTSQPKINLKTTLCVGWTGNAYPSRHLVPSPLWGLACALIVDTSFPDSTPI